MKLTTARIEITSLEIYDLKDEEDLELVKYLEEKHTNSIGNDFFGLKSIISFSWTDEIYLIYNAHGIRFYSTINEELKTFEFNWDLLIDIKIFGGDDYQKAKIDEISKIMKDKNKQYSLFEFKEEFQEFRKKLVRKMTRNPKTLFN